MKRQTLATHLLLFALGLAGLVAGTGCRANQQLVEDNQMLYQRALEQIERRRFLEAVRSLGDMGGVTPVEEKLDPLHKLALADAYFHQGGELNTVEAQSRYESFLSFYPVHPRSSYARFQVGACLMAQAESPQNDQEFGRRALTHYAAMVRDLKPDDPWREPARVMLAKAQDRLAEHEWLVATFYESKKTWNGAIGRFQTIVDTYPLSRRREEAYFRIGENFRRVGDLAQARLNYNRLLSDYPGGAWTEPARAALSALDGQPAPEKPGRRSRR